MRGDRESRLGETSFEENISRRDATSIRTPRENDLRGALASSKAIARYDFDLEGVGEIRALFTLPLHGGNTIFLYKYKFSPSRRVSSAAAEEGPISLSPLQNLSDRKLNLPLGRPARRRPPSRSIPLFRSAEAVPLPRATPPAARRKRSSRRCMEVTRK